MSIASPRATDDHGLVGCVGFSGVGHVMTTSEITEVMMAGLGGYTWWR